MKSRGREEDRFTRKMEERNMNSTVSASRSLQLLPSEAVVLVARPCDSLPSVVNKLWDIILT